MIIDITPDEVAVLQDLLDGRIDILNTYEKDIEETEEEKLIWSLLHKINSPAGQRQAVEYKGSTIHIVHDSTHVFISLDDSEEVDCPFDTVEEAVAHGKHLIDLNLEMNSQEAN
jgi:hypothetical protein